MTKPHTTDNSLDHARADFIQDQLQRARTTMDHSAILKKRSRARISEAKAALADHSPTPKHDEDLSQYHILERMLDERAFYPPHDKRKESSAYAKVHHQMTIADDKRCLVCGVQHSTLHDVAKNPFGAVAMETHHHTIEWALANAIDPIKFNQHIRPGLKRQAEARKADPKYVEKAAVYKEFDEQYENDMSADEIHKWVDHAADNLWVLCDIHHRHKFVGIHAITFPIWGPQDVVDERSVEQQIKNTKE